MDRFLKLLQLCPTGYTLSFQYFLIIQYITVTQFLIDSISQLITVKY